MEMSKLFMTVWLWERVVIKYHSYTPAYQWKAQMKMTVTSCEIFNGRERWGGLYKWCIWTRCLVQMGIILNFWVIMLCLTAVSNANSTTLRMNQSWKWLQPDYFPWHYWNPNLLCMIHLILCLLRCKKIWFKPIINERELQSIIEVLTYKLWYSQWWHKPPKKKYCQLNVLHCQFIH